MFGRDSQRFHLGIAGLEDFPRLKEIFSKAYAQDRYCKVKGLSEKSDAISISDGRLRRMLKSHKYTVLKASDATAGDTLGWACWSRHGYDGLSTAVGGSSRSGSGYSKRPIDAEDLRRVERNKAIQDAVRKAMAEEKTSITDLQTETPLEDIETTLREYYNQHICEAKYMILEHVCVFPVFQRLGIATALVKWGTRKADKEGVICWLHSSEKAHLLFKQEGFEDVGIHMVDLDDFVTKPSREIKDGKWGWYTHRYMRRLPEGSGDEEVEWKTEVRAMKSRGVALVRGGVLVSRSGKGPRKTGIAPNSTGVIVRNPGRVVECPRAVVNRTTDEVPVRKPAAGSSIGEEMVVVMRTSRASKIVETVSNSSGVIASDAGIAPKSPGVIVRISENEVLVRKPARKVTFVT